MKKYTQKDFDNFEVDEFGYKICPSGDYTEIKEFSVKCRFRVGSIFGEWSNFVKECKFERRCNFGKSCSFEESCDFGKFCSFGGCCYFAEPCEFSDCCSFGEICTFNKSCSFGELCSFGDKCEFKKFCVVEYGIRSKSFLKFEGFGSKKRCTYFWLSTNNKVYVRCGCFFGDINEFRKKVEDVYGDNKYAQGYLKIADLAEWYWGLEGNDD